LSAYQPGALNLLFICGSLNQTSMMHKIAGQLGEFNCFFTPFYADGFIRLACKAGLTESTILSGNHRKATENYLNQQRLPVDYGGRKHDYDAVLTGTDLIIQHNIRGKRLILIQEGITESEGLIYKLVRNLGLPRFLANTAATGLSHQYDLFCVASAGYRQLFISKGVDARKIVVTGIPNFDNAQQYLENDFKHHGYVLVATSSIRETYKFNDRERFLRMVKKVAGKRPVIFKLHPNEDSKRAVKEIRRHFPDEFVYTDGNVHEMIANCDVLIAQNSSVVYTGLALGKEVHSYLNQNALKRLLPIQNGGKSSHLIADVCRQLVATPLEKVKWKETKTRLPRKQGIWDVF
jgi:hypothetical protein